MIIVVSSSILHTMMREGTSPHAYESSVSLHGFLPTASSLRHDLATASTQPPLILALRSRRDPQRSVSSPPHLREHLGYLGTRRRYAFVPEFIDGTHHVPVIDHTTQGLQSFRVISSPGSGYIRTALREQRCPLCVRHDILARTDRVV